MSAKHISIEFQYPVLALTTQQAAKAMNISRTTLWKLTQTGQIGQTAYGRYPVAEIDRHLREEAEACIRKNRVT